LGPAALTPGVVGDQGRLGRGATCRSAEKSDGKAAGAKRKLRLGNVEERHWLVVKWAGGVGPNERPRSP